MPSVVHPYSLSRPLFLQPPPVSQLQRYTPVFWACVVSKVLAHGVFQGVGTAFQIVPLHHGPLQPSVSLQTDFSSASAQKERVRDNHGSENWLFHTRGTDWGFWRQSYAWQQLSDTAVISDVLHGTVLRPARGESWGLKGAELFGSSSQ